MRLRFADLIPSDATRWVALLDALFVSDSDEGAVALAAKLAMEWASASPAVATALVEAAVDVLLKKIEDVRTGVGLFSLFAILNRFWSNAAE
jgi:hypothetical protein